jgi:hypothetical protein
MWSIRYMVYLISIFLLASCLASCEISMISTSTTTLSSQEKISPISFVTPMPTFTPTMIQVTPVESYPGANSHSQLRYRISEWIEGDIPYSDEHRWLDEVTAEPLKLGLFTYSPTFNTMFLYYHLGTTVVLDPIGKAYVVTIAGFEYNNGERFTFPFHSGEVNDCADTTLRLFTGKRVNSGRNVYDAFRITPLDFLDRSEILSDLTVFAFTHTNQPGHTESDCRNELSEYYSLASNTTLSLVQFFQCETCSTKDPPSDLISFINVMPETFTTDIPFVPWFHGAVFVKAIGTQIPDIDRDA